jgi:hypothetical protein
VAAELEVVGDRVRPVYQVLLALEVVVVDRIIL